MSFNTGTMNAPTDPILLKPYCAGRTAAKAGSLIGTNPYASGTQEYTYWRRGFRLYKSDGANTYQDCCDVPAKYDTPVLTATEDTNDATGLTYSFALAAAIPCDVHLGDGTVVESETGTLSHTYAEEGTYVPKVVIFGHVYVQTAVEVTLHEEE